MTDGGRKFSELRHDLLDPQADHYEVPLTPTFPK